MPAESARLTRRLRPTDWWFLGLVAVALVAGIVVAAVYVAGSKETVKPGCIATIRAGVMGGQTYSVCGKQALSFCRLHASDSQDLTAECARVMALFGS